MQEQIPWHRLFGMMLTSFFEGSAFRVEYEKDLSFKAQLLDVVIIRTDAEGTVPSLPDGLRDSLVNHNLISFKSYHDTLSDWTLKELTCYYVNYRKQVSPTMNDLLPEDQFRLFALSAHYPFGLAGCVPLTKVQEGVYDSRRGTDLIRIIVLNRLPLDPRNSPLHLFSGQDERVGFGVTNVFPRTDDISTMLLRVFEKYLLEGVDMPQTNEEYRREFFKTIPLKDRLAGVSPEELSQVLPQTNEEYRREFFKTIPLKDRLAGASSTEVLNEFTPQERLKDLSPQERLKDLSPQERLKDLSPNELIQALPPEVLEALRKNLDKTTLGQDDSTRQG